MMAVDFLEDVRRKIQAVKGKILIVGTKAIAFDGPWRDSDRLVFWNYGNMGQRRTATIPKDVDLVLTVRTNKGPALMRGLEGRADSHVQFIKSPVGVGQLRRLFQCPARPIEVVNHVPSKEMGGYAELRDLVAKHVDPKKDGRGQVGHLLKVAKREGVPTSFHAMLNEVERQVRNARVSDVLKIREEALKAQLVAAPPVEEAKEEPKVVEEVVQEEKGEPMVAAAASEPVTVQPPPEPKRFRLVCGRPVGVEPGVASAFIKEHANLQAQVLAHEAQRLQRLAREQKPPLDIKLTTITTSLHRLKKRLLKAAGQPVEAPQAPVAVIPPPPTPPIIPPLPKPVEMENLVDSKKKLLELKALLEVAVLEIDAAAAQIDLLTAERQVHLTEIAHLKRVAAYADTLRGLMGIKPATGNGKNGSV